LRRCPNAWTSKPPVNATIRAHDAERPMSAGKTRRGILRCRGSVVEGTALRVRYAVVICVLRNQATVFSRPCSNVTVGS
jgi:hypothetical protein